MNRERAFLSRTEATRLNGVRVVAELEGTQTMAADRIGMKRTTMAAFLHRVTGSGAWPPDLAVISRLLEMPVLTDAQARIEWSRPKARRDLSLSEERRALSAVLDSAKSGPSLPESEVRERRQARVEERAAHEARWLAAERERYGDTRQTRTRPLSSMRA